MKINKEEKLSQLPRIIVIGNSDRKITQIEK